MSKDDDDDEEEGRWVGVTFSWQQRGSLEWWRLQSLVTNDNDKKINHDNNSGIDSNNNNDTLVANADRPSNRISTIQCSRALSGRQ